MSDSFKYSEQELGVLIEAVFQQNVAPEQRDRLREILASSREARNAYFEAVDTHLLLEKWIGASAAASRRKKSLVSLDTAKPVSGVSWKQVLMTSAATFAIGFASALVLVQRDRPVDAIAQSGSPPVVAGDDDARGKNQTDAPEAIKDRQNLVADSIAPADSLNSSHLPANDAKAGDGDLRDAMSSAMSSVVVSQNANAQLFGERAPMMGQTLRQDHPYILTDGSMQLRFPGGATTILDAPAVFRIAAADRLVLDSGNCSVHTPAGKSGFKVETPIAQVVDNGTRYGLNVKETGQTDVQVVAGKAEVFNKLLNGREDSRPIELTSQAATAISADLPSNAASIQYDPSSYRFGLPDRVLAFDAVDVGDGVSDLTSVTVQRGGEVHEYSISELIPSEVIYYCNNQSKRIMPIGRRAGDRRPVSELLHSDQRLETGLLNPGASKRPLTSDPVLSEDADSTNVRTPGMAIRFKYPVVNGPGPDIVFFELQTFSNPKTGDPFHVSPLSFRDGLKSHTIREYDISLTSPEAKEITRFEPLIYSQPVHSLADVLTGHYSWTQAHRAFRAIATGIDLSDMGYGLSESAEGIFIQDAFDDDGAEEDSRVDPVYIGAFPNLKSLRPDLTQPSI